jgi:hypothetical protein
VSSFVLYLDLPIMFQGVAGSAVHMALLTYLAWPLIISYHMQWIIIDYLSLSATSTDVERVFSQGRLVLWHIQNH